jgi:hypothetical protein
VRLAKTLSSFALLGAILIPCAAQEPGAPKRQEANLLVDVSARLINAAITHPVDRTAPVDEVIQETPVCGIGRTIGAVRTELVPDARAAAIDVVFQGRNYSQTVGERTNVFVYTTGVTSLDVRRRVLIDGNGIRTYAGPAHADAFTTLLGIKSRTWPERFTEQVAKRVFDQTVDAAEAESGYKTAQHVAARLEEDVSPRLASLSKSVGRELKAFQQAELALQSLDLSTTTAAVQARLRFKAPVSPPPSGALPADIDLGVRVHESLANEAAQLELSGRSFTLNEVSKIYNEVTRGLILDGRKGADPKTGLKKIEKLVADLAGKPVTITFAKKDPMTVVFADQGFTVEGRFASIRQDKAVYAGLRVRAIYRFENAADGVHALRQGAVKVTAFEDPDKAAKKAEPLPVQFKLVVDALVNEVLTERLTLAPLPMPEVMKGVRFQAPQAYARDGWVGLAWKLDAR